MKMIWQVIGLGRNLIIAAVAGLLVGCPFGWMVMGWLVVPVQWELTQAEKEQYVLMVADSYALSRDAELARARLRLSDLGDEEIGEIIARLAATRPLQEQQNLLNLSLGLDLGPGATPADAAMAELEVPILMPTAVAEAPHPTNTPVPADTPPPTPTLLPEAPSCTTRVGMNIRAGPGVDYPDIGDIPAGKTLGVIGQDFRQNVVWWKIGEDNSWVSGKYCTGNKEAEKVEFAPAPPSLPPTATDIPASPPTAMPTPTIPIAPPPPPPTPTAIDTPIAPPPPTPTAIDTPIAPPPPIPTAIDTPIAPPPPPPTPTAIDTPIAPPPPTPTPTDTPIAPPPLSPTPTATDTPIAPPPPTPTPTDTPIAPPATTVP